MFGIFFVIEKLFLLLLLSFLIYIIYFFHTYYTRQSPLPGPFPLPLIGNILNFWTYPGDFVDCSSYMHKLYGDIYEVYIGTERCIWICRGDLCDEIYKSSNKFLFKTFTNNGLDEIGASQKGLSYNKNWELWKYYRRLVTKSLTTHEFLRKALEYIQVVWEEMEGYWKELEICDDDNKIIDISKWMSKASTDMTLFLTTNQNVYSLANYHYTLSQNSPILQNIPKGILKSPDAFIENIPIYLESFIFFASIPKFIRMLPGFRERVKFFLDRRALLKKDMQEIIQKRREEIEDMNNMFAEDEEDEEIMKNLYNDGECDNNQNKVKMNKIESENGLCPDLLTMILTMNANRNIAKSIEDNMHSKPMTDDEIEGLLLDVVSGGVETTASTINYIIYYLSHYQQVRECLVKELDHTLGRDPNYKLELEDLNKLKYCEAVIKEVMRVYSTASTNSRMSNEPCEVGGYTFPKKTQFLINSQDINLQAVHWENSHEFNPDRFLDSKKSNQYFQSFGGGLKVCPGKNLAMLHLKSFIVLLYRKWEVELVDMKAPIKSHYTTTKSCKQLEVRIRRRKFNCS